MNLTISQIELLIEAITDYIRNVQNDIEDTLTTYTDLQEAFTIRRELRKELEEITPKENVKII